MNLIKLGFTKHADIPTQLMEEMSAAATPIIRAGGVVDDMVLASIKTNDNSNERKSRMRKLLELPKKLKQYIHEKTAKVEQIAPYMAITELTPEVMSDLSGPQINQPNLPIGEMFARGLNQNKMRIKSVKYIGNPGQFKDPHLTPTMN